MERKRLIKSNNVYIARDIARDCVMADVSGASGVSGASEARHTPSNNNATNNNKEVITILCLRNKCNSTWSKLPSELISLILSYTYYPVSKTEVPMGITIKHAPQPRLFCGGGGFQNVYVAKRITVDEYDIRYSKRDKKKWKDFKEDVKEDGKENVKRT
jgi:hypothetical protein